MSIFIFMVFFLSVSPVFVSSLGPVGASGVGRGNLTELDHDNWAEVVDMVGAEMDPRVYEGVLVLFLGGCCILRLRSLPVISEP